MKEVITMLEEEFNNLLSDVKNYLKISWTDEQTDKNLTGMIKRGIAYLNDVSGTQLDFTEENLAKSLLLDYVRYANSQALEVFDTNFQSELISLHYSKQAELIQLDEEGVNNEN